MISKINKYSAIALTSLILLFLLLSFFVGTDCKYKAKFTLINDTHKVLTCERGKVTELTYKLDKKKISFSQR